MAEDNKIGMKKFTPIQKKGAENTSQKTGKSQSGSVFRGNAAKDKTKGVTLQKENAPIAKKTKLKNGMTVQTVLGKNVYYDASGKIIDEKTFKLKVGSFKVNRSGRYTITSADGKTTKYYAADGTELKKEYYYKVEGQSRSIDSRLAQVSSNLKKAEDSNGFIGSLWSGFKNLTGFGDSSNKVRDQLDKERQLLKRLNSNPNDKAKVFKELTGVDYSPENEEKFNNGKIKLKSEQKLDGYKEGQATAVDVASDLVSGVASFAVAGFALGTAPATLGASLLLLPATGAGTKIATKWLDAKTGGRNYKVTTHDVVMGMVNGGIAPFTAGAGGAVAKSVMAKTGVTVAKEGAKQIIKTGAKQTITKTGAQIAKKGLLHNFSTSAKEAMCYKFVGGSLKNRVKAYAIQGAVDGALSGAAYSGVETAINGGDAGDIAKATLFGAAGGAVFGAAMNGGVHYVGEKFHTPKPQGTKGLTEEAVQDAVPENNQALFRAKSEEAPNTSTSGHESIGADGIVGGEEFHQVRPELHTEWRNNRRYSYITRSVDEWAAEGKCDAQQFYKFIDSGVEPSHAFEVLEQMINNKMKPEAINKAFSESTLSINGGKSINPNKYDIWETNFKSKYNKEAQLEFWNDDNTRKILRFDNNGNISSTQERIRIGEDIELIKEIDQTHKTEITQRFKLPKESEYAHPQLLEENVTFKDTHGNPIYTEQTRLNETGQYEITHIYPDGKTDLVGHVEFANDGGIYSEKTLTALSGEKTKQVVISDKDGNYTLREIITTPDGKKLSEVKKTYKKISENKIQTKVNDTEFTAEYTNDKAVVTRKTPDNKIDAIEVKIVDDIANSSPQNGVILVDRKVAASLKDLSPDQLFNAGKSEVKKISYDYKNSVLGTAGYDSKNQTIIIGRSNDGGMNTDSSLITHEIGHAIDDLNELRNNPELIRLYELEKAEILKQYPDAKLNNMEYLLIDYHDFKGRALAEGFADTNSYQSGFITENGHKVRNMEFAHNFPKTRAKMQELRQKALNGEINGNLHSQRTTGIAAGEEFNIPPEILKSLSEEEKAVFLSLDADMRKGLLEYPDQLKAMLSEMKPADATISSHRFESPTAVGNEILPEAMSLEEALTELQKLPPNLQERVLMMSESVPDIELQRAMELVKDMDYKILDGLTDEELKMTLIGFTESSKGHAPNTIGNSLDSSAADDIFTTKYNSLSDKELLEIANDPNFGKDPEKFQKVLDSYMHDAQQSQHYLGAEYSDYIHSLEDKYKFFTEMIDSGEVAPELAMQYAETTMKVHQIFSKVDNIAENKFAIGINPEVDKIQNRMNKLNNISDFEELDKLILEAEQLKNDGKIEITQYEGLETILQGHKSQCLINELKEASDYGSMSKVVTVAQELHAQGKISDAHLNSIMKEAQNTEFEISHGLRQKTQTAAAEPKAEIEKPFDFMEDFQIIDNQKDPRKFISDMETQLKKQKENGAISDGDYETFTMLLDAKKAELPPASGSSGIYKGEEFNLDNIFELDFKPRTTKEVYEGLPDYFKKAFKESDLTAMEAEILEHFELATIDIVRNPRDIDYILRSTEKEYGAEIKNKFVELINDSPEYRKYLIENSEGRANEFGQTLWGQSWEVNANDIREKLAKAQTYKEIEALEKRLKGQLDTTPFPEHFSGISEGIELKRDELAARAYTHMHKHTEGQILPKPADFRKIITKQLDECENIDEYMTLYSDLKGYKETLSVPPELDDLKELFKQKRSILDDKELLGNIESAQSLKRLNSLSQNAQSSETQAVLAAKRAEITAKLENAYTEFKAGKSVPTADEMEDIITLKLQDCKTFDDLKPLFEDVKLFNKSNNENIMLVRGEGLIRAKGDEIRTGLLADFSKRADECTTEESINQLRKEFRAFKKSDEDYKHRKLGQYAAHRRGEDNYQDRILDIYTSIDRKIKNKSESFKPQEKYEWYIDENSNLKKNTITKAADDGIYRGDVFPTRQGLGDELEDIIDDVVPVVSSNIVEQPKKKSFWSRLFSRSKSEPKTELKVTPKYEKVEFPQGHKYTREDIKLELESYFADSEHRDYELWRFEKIFKNIENMDLENAAEHIKHIKIVFKGEMTNDLRDIVKHGYFNSKEGAEAFEYFAKRFTAIGKDYKRSELDIILSNFDVKNFKKAQERGLLDNLKGDFRSVEEVNRLAEYTDKQFAMYKEFKAKNIEFVSDNDDINRLFLKYGEGKYPFTLEEINDTIKKLGDEKEITNVVDKLIQTDNPSIVTFLTATKDAKYVADNIERLTILENKLQLGSQKVSIPDDFDWGFYSVGQIKNKVYKDTSRLNKLLDIMESKKFTDEQLYEIGLRMNEKSTDFINKIALDKDLTPQEVLDITNGTRFIFARDLNNVELSQNLELYNSIMGFSPKLKAACEKHGLDLNPYIEELTETFDKKYTTFNVHHENQQAFNNSILGNNNAKAFKVLTETDFSKYGKGGIPLKYSRDEFCQKVNDILSSVNEKERAKILKHFGLEENPADKTFDGILNNTPYIDDFGSKKTKNAAAQIMVEIEKFTLENEVKISDPALKSVMEDLIKGMPEFALFIGKKQHGTHEYSVDIHTLKVLQSAMKDPKYNTLTDAEKTMLKLSAIMHDFGKKGNIIDTGHEILSTDYTKALLDRYPFPKEMKQRITDMVKNHHWFADFNTGKTDATDVALMFRNEGDLKIAEILAKADFENVSKDFHLENIPVKPTQENFDIYMDQQFAKVEAARIQLNRHAAPVYADRFSLNGEKFPKKRIIANGSEKEMGVLNLNELPPNTPMTQFGYAPGVTSSNMTYVAHFAEDASTLETVLKVTGNPHKDSVWSAGVFNSGDTRSYGGRDVCVIFDYEQSKVIDAANQSLQSGYQKDITTVKHQFEVMNKWDRESGVVETIRKTLKKSGVKLDNEEYSQLADYLYSKKYPTQFRNNITINGKNIDAQTLQKASSDVKKYLLSAEDYNEIEIEKPIAAALGIKAKNIEEVPQWFIDMADKYGLKMILLP